MVCSVRDSVLSLVAVLALMSGCVAGTGSEIDSDKGADFDESTVNSLKECANDASRVQARWDRDYTEDVALPFAQLKEVIEFTEDFPEEKWSYSDVFFKARTLCESDELDSAYFVIGVMKDAIQKD